MSTLDRIIAMATAISESGLEIDNDTIVLSKSAYYDNLPKGITQETAMAVNQYNMEFVAATGYLTGQQAQQWFSDNPEVETINMVCPIDHAEVNHTVYRNYMINETEHPMYLVSGYMVHTRNLEQDVIRSVIDQVSGMLPTSQDEAA